MSVTVVSRVTAHANIRLSRTGAVSKEAPSKRPSHPFLEDHVLIAISKPETAEKLLARIRDSSVHDEVIAALLQSSSSRQQTQAVSASQLDAEQLPTYATNTTQQASYHSSADNDQNLECLEETNDEPLCGDLARERNGQASLISPLHILAATVSRKRSSRNSYPQTSFSRSDCDRIGKTATNSVDEKVAKYFCEFSRARLQECMLISGTATQPTYKRDWDVLTAQSIDSTFKLEAGACDPVTARLVTQEDAAYYFHLCVMRKPRCDVFELILTGKTPSFFTTRNPLIGLLEVNFHTLTYVFDTSFTLFSAVCALGCAVSARPRDRLLYPALYSIAEADMKWSIATSVKSLEIIQAIIIMQYWAPVSERQLEDPYWLHLNHVSQSQSISRPA